TQAQYGEVHVQRLRVVRALVDAGVSIAEVRRVVATLETPPESAHELLGSAHAAITRAAEDDIDLAAAEELVTGLGWEPGLCDRSVLSAVARALDGLRSASFEVPPDVMTAYLRGMREIADAEIAGVPTESAGDAVRCGALGSGLAAPLLLA